ncbi:quinone oxidoreductase [Protomyces lactucae-debilis]|uniref:Quinone oxidoreductase n=1 Tax=Protomyces lactucae-debilis TaxID=2754530 RepID=A0A1Y2FLT5_PROLT|nr:quinone oxidoreductase [Protomyces lactucae-debilis]ORY84324.1 quinone oxidoreductase [Protomyces lactucae-debilis]
MKAVQLKEYVKDPSGLKVSSIADPVPGPGDLLIDIHAAATNFFDTLQIQGKYQTQPPFPWVAGAEFAGVVEKAPEGSAWSVGDKVFGAGQGSFAEKIVVKDTPGAVLPMPDGWSFVDACGLYVTAPTSYLALVNRAQLKKGETCLVHAAAGGVGLAAVQIAKALGAIVIATAGSADKLQVAKDFGADHCVNYTDKDYLDQIKKITKGKGCDVIYDPVGKIQESFKVVAWNGRILVIGFAGGKIEKVAMNLALLKQASIVGVFWGGNAIRRPNEAAGVWQGLMEMMSNGQLRPTVFSKVYDGLDGVAPALNALASRGTWGKVVINMKKDASSKL